MRHLLALLLLLGAYASANDRIGINHVRFSGSGGAVLVLSSGVQDGSGLGVATLTVLSTGSGAVLYRRTRTADLPPNTLRLWLLNTPPAPVRLGAAGLLPGRVSAARYNRSYPTPFPQWSDAATAGQSQQTAVALWSQPVPIRLDVFALPASCPAADLLPGGVTAGLRVTVNTQVVHLDTALPADRRCAGGYTLERVDVQGNRALLTVRVYGPGFEGPDATPLYLAVTLR